MKTLRAAAAAASVAAFALPATAATTFDFFWTGDPAAGSALASSGDATATASGVFVIDAGPNDVVGPADVLSFSLVFGTTTLGLFEMTDANVGNLFFDGTVSADGSTIAMTDFFVGTDDFGETFGCISVLGDCGPMTSRHITMVRNNTAPSVGFLYDSTEDARASLRFTARETTVIPLPATLPLLLGALGLLAVARRRAA